MEKILRVEWPMKTRIEQVPPEWTELGGRALTSTIVAKEVSPTCHPLGEHNKLIFAPGLLSGTRAPIPGAFPPVRKVP